MVASWAPAAQGPSHDVAFYAYWAHAFYFCKLHTFSFFGPVSVFFAQEGPPNEFFYTFWGRAFAPAPVQIFNGSLLRSVFLFLFAASKKCVQTIPKSTWGGATTWTRFCMYRSHTKQNKKVKKLSINCTVTINNNNSSNNEIQNDTMCC